MEDFKDQVKRGFSKCRLDIETIKDENTELYSSVTDLKTDNVRIKNQISELQTENKLLKDANIELKSTIQTLNQEVSNLKGEMKGINIALDYIKNMQINQTTSQQVQTPEPVVQTPAPQQIQTPNTQMPIQEISQNNIKIMNEKEQPIIRQEKPKHEDPYQALLAFKAKINKKEMLKQKLISMINEVGINLSELKFLFVDHYKYCSKATFYNYLKEIELEKQVVIKREKTKNYVYLNQEMLKDEI